MISFIRNHNIINLPYFIRNIRSAMKRERKTRRWGY